MQKRHADHKQYFIELAQTARDYYINHINNVKKLTGTERVLEIGCGEGGNLVPFSELGCEVYGLDLNQAKIDSANEIYPEFNKNGAPYKFECKDFIKCEQPQTEEERYDIVLIHDVIEHIEPEFKETFFKNALNYLKSDGIMFYAFPVWHMPFGGHQQVCKSGLLSKLPYFHLLPACAYKWILEKFGESKGLVDELLSIKRCKMTPENFRKWADKTGYTEKNVLFWFINPHYKEKFGLSPRKMWKWFAGIPYLRNFSTTSIWFLVGKK